MDNCNNVSKEPTSLQPCKHVAILATAKTGNLWLRFVIGTALSLIDCEVPPDEHVRLFLQRNTADVPIIFHSHVAFDTATANALTSHGACAVTLIRHPLDIFVSMRRHIARHGPVSAEESLLISEDIADVIKFARTFFIGDLAISSMWSRSGAAVIRYEELLLSPMTEFTTLAVKLRVKNGLIPSFAAFCSEISDISFIKSLARPEDAAHFTTPATGKWRSSEHHLLMRSLLQEPAITTAIHAWGYADDNGQRKQSFLRRHPSRSLSTIDGQIPVSPFLRLLLLRYNIFEMGIRSYHFKPTECLSGFGDWLVQKSKAGELTHLEAALFRVDTSIREHKTRDRWSPGEVSQYVLKTGIAETLGIPLKFLTS